MFLQVLITIGAAQALTRAVLILLKRQRNQADYFLALEVGLMFAIVMFYNYRQELSAGYMDLPLNSLELGYLARNRYRCICRSNPVKTPRGDISEKQEASSMGSGQFDALASYSSSDLIPQRIIARARG